jgi:hypothetical protein
MSVTLIPDNNDSTCDYLCKYALVLHNITDEAFIDLLTTYDNSDPYRQRLIKKYNNARNVRPTVAATLSATNAFAKYDIADIIKIIVAYV